MLETAGNVNSFVQAGFSAGNRTRKAMTDRLIVQIYEVQTPDEAEILIALGVDHLGSVILSGESWKDRILRETVETIGRSPSLSCLIPLFSQPETVFQALDYYRPHIVHFCENLADRKDVRGRCESLIRLQEEVRKRFPEIRIMRSIPIIRQGSDGTPAVPSLEIASWFEPSTDYFLTDTHLPRAPGSHEDPQPVQGFIGITGLTCDWAMAAELVRESAIPVILGGGISPENVYNGIIQVQPSGVDSCTGTNALDPAGRPVRFKKNPEKVRRLVVAARQAERDLSEIRGQKSEVRGQKSEIRNSKLEICDLEP
jgi:phosphoribosylanthranilate isomerase